jgi:hypothetical protein
MHGDAKRGAAQNRGGSAQRVHQAKRGNTSLPEPSQETVPLSAAARELFRFAA